MMQPYMGVYGITKILLEQPCNLELQIYWETHGFLRLESKQWGNFESQDTAVQVAKSITVPLNIKVGNVFNVMLTDSKLSQYSPISNLIFSADKDLATNTSFHIDCTVAPSSFYWFMIGK